MAACGSARAIRGYQAWLLPALIVILAGLLGVSLAVIRNATSSGRLVVDERALDFGEVWVQERFVWTLPVTNASGEDLAILRVLSSCHCTAVTPQQLALAPGETRELELTLDLVPRRPEDRDGAVWDFSVELHPHVRGMPPRHITWQVHGRVRNLLDISPRVVEVPQIRGEPVSAATVTVSSRERLSGLRAECPTGLGTATVESAEPGKYVVAIRPSAQESAGLYDFRVGLHPITGAGTELPAIPLPVRVNVTEDVQPIPPVLVLGGVPVGEQVTEELVLASQTAKAFRVVRIETDRDAGTQVSPQPEGQSERAMPAWSYRIVQSATAARGQTAKVLFHVIRDGESAPSIIPVKISYHGMQEQNVSDTGSQAMTEAQTAGGK